MIACWNVGNCRCRCGQTIQQGFDTAPGGGKARAQRVAFLRQCLHLAAQKGIGALQLFVTDQQPLDALGNLFDGGLRVHSGAL